MIWNDFVTNSPWSDILQFEQWGETKRQEGWSPYFIGEESDPVRSMVLLKPTPLLGNYLYVPHGPVFHSVEDLEKGIGEWKRKLIEFAKEQNCFVIDVDPKVGSFSANNIETLTSKSETDEKSEVEAKNAENLKHFTDKRIIEILEKAGFRKTGRNMQPLYKLLYSLDLSEDEIMSLMSKSTRYNVRYAKKHGVEIKEYLPDDPMIEAKLKQFYELLLEMQKRAGGYPVRPYESFVKLFESFKGTDNLSLFEAVYEGDTIIMTISPRTKYWSSSFYAGSNRLHPKIKAPYLIRWAAVKKAKEAGCKVYDFWGVIPNSGQHKGYSDNKLSFGGTRIDHVGIMQLPISPIRAKLFNIALPLRAKFAIIKRSL